VLRFQIEFVILPFVFFQIKEDTSGDGIESLINRVESLIVDGDLSTAVDTLEGGKRSRGNRHGVGEAGKETRCSRADA
jgi:hypothetical protein